MSSSLAGMAESGTPANGLSQWWPKGPNDKTNSLEWRLDVITLLAVIGESSMAEHSQTITASGLCLLPRILPAPQALLKPSRPQRMPQTPAKLTGVYSGVVLDTVGFFANIIHPLDKFQPFEFKILEIVHADPGTADRSRFNAGAARTGGGFSHLHRLLRWVYPSSRDKMEEHEMAEEDGGVGNEKMGRIGVTSSVGVRNRASGVGLAADPERGISRRSTKRDKHPKSMSAPARLNRAERPAVPAALFSPLHILAVFSMILTGALLAGARVWTDGPAIMAVSLISLQSSLVGYASWWKPVLMLRTHNHRVPRGDVMIRTREGAFILIRCTEDVARELYTAGTEECRYRVGERWYRFMMGVGTIMLMLSTVLLGNCSWYMQLFVGSSYISLNAVYWAMGMLPRTLFWDLSRYRWDDKTPLELQNAHLSKSQQRHETVSDGGHDDEYESVASFTRTLWYAIRATKVTGWVLRSGAAPMTDEWKQWLREAEAEAQDEAKAAAWKPVYRKQQIIANGMDNQELVLARAAGQQPRDPGKQHAPLSEIQGPASVPATVAGTNSF